MRQLVFAIVCAVATLASAQTTQPNASPKPVQVAAFYFPNWHHHDGKFGEWDSLRNARPRFPGHAQPKEPLWGAEDEADPVVMAKKIDAAADHGIGAFVFDWYYGAKGPFLERALDEGYLHASNRVRVKFALMWANDYAYGRIDREKFDRIVDRIVADYLTKPSYWTIEGKPVFSIYDIDSFIKSLGGIEAATDAVKHLRESAIHAGLAGVHLNVIDWKLVRRADAAKVIAALGIDSSTSYCWPHHVALKHLPTENYVALGDRYDEFRNKMKLNVPHWPNVTMGWDPSPRMPADQPIDGRGYPNTPIVVNNTAANFRNALVRARAEAMTLPSAQRIVTVYAWNEWTEGGYLEPDRENGFAYLDAIRDVFGR